MAAVRVGTRTSKRPVSATRRIPSGGDAGEGVRRHRRAVRRFRALVPIGALVIGVASFGVVYVSQSARLTQTTYEAGTLASQESQLQLEANQLQSQLALLTSTPRIDAAASSLKMVQASQWTLVPLTTISWASNSAATGSAVIPSTRLHGLFAELSGTSVVTKGEG